ncbi:MAG: thermonuclease family protein [Clostridiales bacterium]
MGFYRKKNSMYIFRKSKLIFINTIILMFLIFSSCNKENDSNIIFTENELVIKVIDGDTFYIKNDEKVRLIGIDTPEIGNEYGDDQPYSQEAKNFTRNLIEGKEVKLVKDISDRDRYNRLLRYVYMNDGTFLNELLVKEGFAKSIEYKPDIRFTDILNSAQKYAKKNNRVIWSD